MSTKAGLPLFAGGLLAATVMFVPCAPSAAQERPAISTDFSAQQQQENKDQQKKAAPAARPAPQRAAPQRAAPQRAAPQRAAPQRAAPQRVAPQRSAPREAAPRRAQPRVVTPQRTAPREVTPRRTAPSTVTRQKALRAWSSRPLPLRASSCQAVREPSPRPACAGFRRAALAALSSTAKITQRGVAATVSARRRLADLCGAQRIGRDRNRLDSILSLRLHFGTAALLCGITEDGCELMWQEVETIEGDVINQCVAYCPWQ